MAFIRAQRIPLQPGDPQPLLIVVLVDHSSVVPLNIDEVIGDSLVQPVPAVASTDPAPVPRGYPIGGI